MSWLWPYIGMSGTGQQCVIRSGGRSWLGGATATKQGMVCVSVGVWHHVFLSVGLIPHANPGFGFHKFLLSCEICLSHSSFFSSGHPPFPSPVSHTGHTPSWEFLKISKIMNVCVRVCVSVLVIHLTDRQEPTQPRQVSFYHRTSCRNRLSVQMMSFSLSVFFFFCLFAQPNTGETVSHPSPLHWNLVCVCFLPEEHTNTCCLKWRRIVFVPHIRAIVRLSVECVCACWLDRQRETLRNWNLVAPPLPCPTGHAGVCVCVAVPGFIHLFEARADGELGCINR